MALSWRWKLFAPSATSMSRTGPAVWMPTPTPVVGECRSGGVQDEGHGGGEPAQCGDPAILSAVAVQHPVTDQRDAHGQIDHDWQ